MTALRIQNLRYRYPDGTPGLNGIDLDVQEGERLAVIGPNGAGKSTLFFHLNGIFRGDGELHVFNQKLSDKTVSDIRKMVGLVFQDPNDQLFMPTVFEDVAFGPMNLGYSESEVHDRVMTSLRRVGMEKAGAAAPHHLSLGERKKVAMATVLALEPKILAFDEPTSGLDPRSRRSLISFLKTLPQTLLVATHDLELVLDLCTRAILLDSGRIVYEGRVPDLFENEGVLEQHGLEKPLRLRISQART